MAAPSRPVSPIVTRRRSRAVFSAARMLGDFPLVDSHRLHSEPGQVLHSRTKPDRLGDGRSTGFELMRYIVGRE